MAGTVGSDVSWRGSTTVRSSKASASVDVEIHCRSRAKLARPYM
ncbi:hypothetical protein [Nonomuraea sp. NPDC049141]